MKLGAITTNDMPDITIPEGLLSDAIRSYLKKANYPKKVIIRQLELLIDKYNDKQETIAKRIVSINEGNVDMHSEIDRLRHKNGEMIMALRGKLS